MYKTNHTRRRILAMLLSLALLISVLPTFALGAEEKDPLEKLNVKLVEALQNASAADKIPVWIWLDGPSRLALEDMIAQECGPEPGQGCTAEEANAYLAARRAVIGREHLAYNEKFAAEVLPEIPQSDYLYFSKYTSTLIAKLTVAQIRAAAYDPRVNELSLYENHPLVSGGEEEEPLTLEEQICADYYASLKDPEAQPEDVFIDRYYGSFNGYEIVLMGIRNMGYTDDMLYLNVGGFVFEFSSGSCRKLFLAYRDGEFIPVKEAYEQGLLTVKDVYELYRAFYKNAQPPCFLDVRDPNAFYFDPVYWAYGAEITKGESETRFGPDKGCTRGQVVTFLWRAAGSPSPAKTETGFTDLKPGAFYEKAVAWAVENGITKGLTDTTFGPDATCTRGQIVTFLYRANGAPEFKKGNNPFKDVASGQFYADAVAWAVENGVTKGKTADEFRPDATCTRGEVVTFLYRAMLLPEPVEPEPALTEVNAMLLRGPSKGDNDTLPKQTVIISSTKELQDYLESVYEMEYFGGIAPDKYTDAYFVNNVLLLVPIRVCGSAPGFTITYVTENGKQILVELEKPGDPESPDMCAWVLLIEAAKAASDREVVIDINQPLGPDCFYGFEAQSVDELIAWINGDVDEDSEAYWQREYFEDYMDAVEKKKRIPVVESAAQTYTRWSINVSSDTNILEYSFQNNDPEQGGLYIDFLMPDKPLEELIEEEGAFLREYFSDWELTESTVKVGGVDTQIFSWGGVENTIRESCKKVFEAPTAWFEYDGFVVHMYGDYRMSQTKWDNAWLEQFVFSIVELT